jgi:hypothetical protein
LGQHRILDQLKGLMQPIQTQWGKDLQSYPNGGEWRLKLHVDGSGRVTRIEVSKDSLRHSRLRKLLRTFEGAWKLSSARTGSAVELDVVVRFCAER